MLPPISAPTEIFHKAESSKVIVVRVTLTYLSLLAVFFLPVTSQLLIGAVVIYFLKFFATEGGAHRYFAHRAYKTSRGFQLLLAILVAASAQRGPLWWADNHRQHHRFADGPGDPLFDPNGSSPHKFSLFKWMTTPGVLDTNLEKAKDLAKFPELVWMNKHHQIFIYISLIIPMLLGEFTAIFGAKGMGLSAGLWLYAIPTFASAMVLHLVNAFAHHTKPGFFFRRRFDTKDSTTNLWWATIPTMGASYHNNHHRFMNSASTGFYWYEPDLCYWVLRVLQFFGLVWDLNPVPQNVLDEGRMNDIAKQKQSS